MRYQGNILHNLKSAAMSNDKALIKDLILDKTAELIQVNPKAIIKALRMSNVKVSNSATKGDLISLAVKSIYENRIFQKNLAVTIASNGIAQDSSYSNLEDGADGGADGGGGVQGLLSQLGGGGGGGGGGGAAAGIVGSVADMIGSISMWGASKNELKAEEAKSKSLMYSKIFGANEKKTNWLPIVAIAGVLLIGGVVVYRVTAK